MSMQFLSVAGSPSRSMMPIQQQRDSGGDSSGNRATRANNNNNSSSSSNSSIFATPSPSSSALLLTPLSPSSSSRQQQQQQQHHSLHGAALAAVSSANRVIASPRTESVIIKQVDSGTTTSKKVRLRSNCVADVTGSQIALFLQRVGGAVAGQYTMSVERNGASVGLDDRLGEFGFESGDVVVCKSTNPENPIVFQLHLDHSQQSPDASQRQQSFNSGGRCVPPHSIAESSSPPLLRSSSGSASSSPSVPAFHSSSSCLFSSQRMRDDTTSLPAGRGEYVVIVVNAVKNNGSQQQKLRLATAGRVGDITGARIGAFLVGAAGAAPGSCTLSFRGRDIGQADKLSAFGVLVGDEILMTPTTTTATVKSVAPGRSARRERGTSLGKSSSGNRNNGLTNDDDDDDDDDDEAMSLSSASIRLALDPSFAWTPEKKTNGEPLQTVTQKVMTAEEEELRRIKLQQEQELAQVCREFGVLEGRGRLYVVEEQSFERYLATTNFQRTLLSSAAKSSKTKNNNKKKGNNFFSLTTTKTVVVAASPAKEKGATSTTTTTTTTTGARQQMMAPAEANFNYFELLQPEGGGEQKSLHTPSRLPLLPVRHLSRNPLPLPGSVYYSPSSHASREANSNSSSSLPSSIIAPLSSTPQSSPSPPVQATAASAASPSISQPTRVSKRLKDLVPVEEAVSVTVGAAGGGVSPAAKVASSSSVSSPSRHLLPASSASSYSSRIQHPAPRVGASLAALITEREQKVKQAPKDAGEQQKQWRQSQSPPRPREVVVPHQQHHQQHLHRNTKNNNNRNNLNEASRAEQIKKRNNNDAIKLLQRQQQEQQPATQWGTWKTPAAAMLATDSLRPQRKLAQNAETIASVYKVPKH